MISAPPSRRESWTVARRNLVKISGRPSNTIMFMELRLFLIFVLHKGRPASRGWRGRGSPRRKSYAPPPAPAEGPEISQN